MQDQELRGCREVCRIALLKLEFYLTTSSAAGHAVEQACFMRICQPSRSHTRSNRQENNYRIMMSLVKLFETMSHLCRSSSIFQEILLAEKKFSRLRLDRFRLLHSYCSVCR